MKRKAIIIDGISYLLITLFVYAAVIKVLDFTKFSVQVSQSPLLRPVAPIVPFAIPLGEVLIAFMLLVPRWQLKGLYASYTLMLSFSLYIIAVLHFSEYIPCSCGGILENMNWTQHLIFNGAFVTLSAVAILLYDPSTVAAKIPPT
jgi:hypothetical protein